MLCLSAISCGGGTTSSGGDMNPIANEMGLELGQQHAAARKVLTEINPVSIEARKEFGGYIFRNSDGSFGSTAPIMGTRSNILLPDRNTIIPPGSIATAWYHTHGALLSAESFSAQDNDYSASLALDAYLATASGQFRYRQLSTGKFFALRGL